MENKLYKHSAKHGLETDSFINMEKA